MYGSTYQAYQGFAVAFSENCVLELNINVTLEECFNSCNIRKRCLHIMHGYDSEAEGPVCFVSQCSPGLYPELWDFSPYWNATTLVRNCAGNNVIGKHSHKI